MKRWTKFSHLSKQTEKAVNDSDVAYVMNLIDANGVINYRNVRAAPVLPSKGLTTADLGDDLAMLRVALNPKISLFEENIALLQQKIKNLKEER